MTATEPRPSPEKAASSPATVEVGGSAGATPAAEPASPAPRKASLPYFASLDGLRGLGLIFVVTYHAGYTDLVKGAYLAVSMFFTLSGFLITSLIVREHDAHGRIDMKRFYIQRFRRLMPAAYAGIILVAAFGLFAAADNQMANLRGDLLSAQFYVANWRFILSNQGYAELFNSPSPVLHFWSLAIEEQFYLLYPLVVLVVLRLLKASVKVLGIVIAALFVVSTALPRLVPMTTDRFYYGTDTRGAEILAGVLLAILLSRRRLDEPGWSPRLAAGLRTMGTLAFLATMVLWFMLPRENEHVYDGGLALYGVLSALLVWGAITPGALIAKILGVKVLRELGKISYGVYVYHWPIFLWLSPERLGLSQFWTMWVRFAVTLAAALLSNHFYELPIRKGRHLFKVPNYQVGMAMAVAAVGIIMAVTVNAPESTEAAEGLSDPVDASQVRSVGPFAAPPTTLPTAIAASPKAAAVPTPKDSLRPDRRLRVLFVGDSTAVSLANVAKKWGDQNDVFTVVNGGIRGCGIVRGMGKVRVYKDQKTYLEKWNTSCDWGTKLPQQLADVQPDLIVVSQSLWDTTDHMDPATNTLVAPGQAVYDAKIKSEYSEFLTILAGEGVPVLWLRQPPAQWGTGLTYEGRPFDPGSAQRMDRLNTLVAEAGAPIKLFRAVPYDTFFLTWPGGLYDKTLRPDGIHPTSDGRDVIGGDIVIGWLGPELLWTYWDVWRTAATR